MANKHTLCDLYQMQSLPLSAKIRMTQYRINQWLDEFGQDGVYVSFSGGKDSTVLLDIVRNVCGFKNVPAVFVDVPTQYPELKTFAIEFCKNNGIELVILKPEISFMEVCNKYGFPLFSKEISGRFDDLYSAIRHGRMEQSYAYKQLLGTYITKNGKKPMISIQKYKFILDAPFKISAKCCYIMKKKPIKDYSKLTNRKAILATMASESMLRTQSWLKDGCNSFDSNNVSSRPLSFWTEQDILLYIKENNLPICSVYGDIVVDYESEGNIEGQITLSDVLPDVGLFESANRPLKTTGCNRTGCVLCGFGCTLEKPDESRFLRLKSSHPKFHNLLYILNNNGVTYAEAIDWINQYGGYNVKY